MSIDRIVRCLLVLLAALVLPAAAAAQGFDFRPPPGPDDPGAVDAMRDLARRIVPVYQEARSDAFLANLTALQIVSGAYAAAVDTSGALRQRSRGKPQDGLLERAIVDGLYARARALQAAERIDFPAAFARAFDELLPTLDNAQAAAVMAQLGTPLAAAQAPVRQAFERWRAVGSIPQTDALALVRTWLAYESRRSFSALLPALFAAEQRSRYLAQPDVVIPLPDGGALHARLVRPGRAKGPLPAVLRFTLDPVEDDAQRSAFEGYAGVTAYVRGRMPDGQGTVTPFADEGDDAAAVIDWIARQPWSDGRVAMIGEGFSGYTAWAAARNRPPALKAIATAAPMAPGIDFPMAGQIFRNTMVRWTQEHVVAGRTSDRPDPEADARWRSRDLAWYSEDHPYWNIDSVQLGSFDPLIRSWLTHPSLDRFWQRLLPSPQQLAQLDIPVLTVGGYYDGAAAGALYYHHELRRHRPGADETLLLGPYDAASVRQGTQPALRGYTLDAAARVDLPQLRYRWLAHVLNGAPKPALLQGRVNLQVMGADRWRHAPALQAGRGRPLRLYLDTRGRGDTHRLLPAATAAGGRTQLAVDLADRHDVEPPGPEPLRPEQLPSRHALRFVSEPLAADTEIAGRLHGTFDITPSRQDVDLHVSLYEQNAHGELLLLFEPYDFRASYAGHRETRRLLRAGQRQSLNFSVERATARRLAAGSRLVLVVGINKRADRQVNFGSGKDVNTESSADARGPLRVRWHERSHIEIPAGGP